MSEATVRCPKCGHEGIVITELLNSDLRLIADLQAAEIEWLRAERIDLVRWMLDRIEDGWHGCVTGDCPHEQASDCIDSLLECFDVDMAARAAGGES